HDVDRHLAREQDALGADRARRRHRHHVLRRMTSLIRGLDESLRASTSAMWPNVVFVRRWGRQLRLGHVVHGSPPAAELHDRGEETYGTTARLIQACQ